MTDMLKWGIDWLAGMSKDNASQLVSLSWENGAVDDIPCSFVDEAGRVLNAVTKTQTEFTRFLFQTKDLVDNQVPLTRGLRVKWGTHTYEAVVNGGTVWTYNDAFKVQIVLSTKHVSDSSC
jgi:hypothetical protein